MADLFARIGDQVAAKRFQPFPKQGKSIRFPDGKAGRSSCRQRIRHKKITAIGHVGVTKNPPLRMKEGDRKGISLVRNDVGEVDSTVVGASVDRSYAEIRHSAGNGNGEPKGVSISVENLVFRSERHSAHPELILCPGCRPIACLPVRNGKRDGIRSLSDE